MQRILNCRAGTLAHLPDYGLPDLSKIIQGMPGTAHELIGRLSAVLLKYEPRLKKITVVLLEQKAPGELRYAISRHAPPPHVRSDNTMSNHRVVLGQLRLTVVSEILNNNIMTNLEHDNDQ